MQTRKKVFETNSSSSHSVVIDDGIDFKNVNFGEEIEILQGEFGWDEEEFNDVYSKMSYAYTYAKNYGRKEDIEDLKNVIEEFSKSKVKFSDVEGYIDHQSVEEAEEIFRNKETIKKFIFGKKSYFLTDNDNH